MIFNHISNIPNNFTCKPKITFTYIRTLNIKYKKNRGEGKRASNNAIEGRGECFGIVGTGDSWFRMFTMTTRIIIPRYPSAVPFNFVMIYCM